MYKILIDNDENRFYSTRTDQKTMKFTKQLLKLILVLRKNNDRNKILKRFILRR